MSDIFENPEDSERVPSTDETSEIIVRPRPARTTRFNIDTFRTEINKAGIVSTHSYLVTFGRFNSESSTARPIAQFLDNESEMLPMRCDSAILPGIRLLKDETIRRYGYGPIERVPYAVQFNDITLNWVLDRNSKILDFFNQWMRMVVNFDSAGGRDMQTERAQGDLSFAPYEMGYKDDYVIPKMNIFIYDNENDQIAVYEIFDVFPSAINDVPVAWGEQDTPLRLSIEFSYTDINILTPKSSQDFPEDLQRELTGIEALLNDQRFAPFLGDARTLTSQGIGRLFSGSF